MQVLRSQRHMYHSSHRRVAVIFCALSSTAILYLTSTNAPSKCSRTALPTAELFLYYKGNESTPLLF
jgi:hypothetical protein